MSRTSASRTYQPVHYDYDEIATTFLDTPEFAAYAIQVRSCIGKQPTTLGSIRRKLTNDRWLQDAIAALIGAGEIERAGSVLLPTYHRIDKPEAKPEIGWNGWRKTKENEATI